MFITGISFLCHEMFYSFFIGGKLLSSMTKSLNFPSNMRKIIFITFLKKKLTLF